VLGTPSVAQVLPTGSIAAAVLLMFGSRTAVLVPLIGVLTVATTWFGLYLTVIQRWAP
jgi:hypothetical protein